MKATSLQLQFIEDIFKNYGVQYIDYGFHSDGSIGVLCKDQFSEFNITVSKNGVII